MSVVLRGEGSRKKLSDNQKAARAWFGCNGDVERAHCTGVYLRKPRSKDVDPILGVYVDSNIRMTDFRANKEIYLARLANYGLRVSDVEFRLTRLPKKPSPHSARTNEAQAPMPLPPLSTDEQRAVDEMCSDLPDGLRASVSRAVSMSKRAEKRK